MNGAVRPTKSWSLGLDLPMLHSFTTQFVCTTVPYLKLPAIVCLEQLAPSLGPLFPAAFPVVLRLGTSAVSSDTGAG